MAEDEGLISNFRRFPKVFWVVQIFELLERGAYYTMIPILAVHAYYNVGVPYWLALILTVFMYPFQYGLPIFTGAYAEKGGYKRQMVFAFSLLTAAYVFLSFAFDAMTMVIGVILIGIGIGSYKPLVSATVAKCTPQKDRNAAYATYYLIVNLAAAVFPIVWVVLEFANIMSLELYRYVFLAGGMFFLVNIFVALFIFEEVPRTGEVRTVGDVVRNIKVAFVDKKFVVMVLLIGGFWALYSSFLAVLPMVLIGFHLVPVWFTAMLLGVFNPLTIILAGPYLIKTMDKVESIRLLMGGVLIYCIGLCLIGLTLQWVFVIIGIVIASVGEFLVAPGYLSFVSKLAPKDKVSAYIGCNFLSTMLGITMGTLFFGLLASYIAFDLGRPFFMYGILVSFGLGLLVAFIYYYRAWGQDILNRAKQIRADEGEEEQEVDEDYVEPIVFRVFENRLSTVLPVLFIPVILFSTYSLGTMEFYGVEDQGDLQEYEWVDASSDVKVAGTASENSQDSNPVNFAQDRFASVKVSLSWNVNEASSYPGGTNGPDQLGFRLLNPMEEVVIEEGVSTSGSASGTFTLPQGASSKDYKGEWTLIIDCGDCGDDVAFISILGVRSTADTSCDYDATVTFTYQAKETPQ